MHDPIETDGFFDPRCKVCNHPQRREIDIALEAQVPYVHLESQYALPYRSLSNHLRKHVNHEDAELRRIIEERSVQDRENREIGIEMEVRRRLVLDLCLKIGIELLVGGNRR